MASQQQGDRIVRAMKIHEDAVLCRFLLSTVTTSRNLELRESDIPDAGTGLFSAQEIPTGEEIFRSNPLVNCRDYRITDTCDVCFKSTNSSVHNDGRFYGVDDEEPTMKACSGCRVARYCSRVCLSG